MILFGQVNLKYLEACSGMASQAEIIAGKSLESESITIALIKKQPLRQW